MYHDKKCVKKAHTPIKSSMECYALHNLTKKAVLTLLKILVCLC